MITIKEQTSSAAWRETFKTLYAHGSETDNDKYFRDELTVIEISKPAIESDSLFPMAQQDLDTITRFIWSGEHEESVVHEWTKLYYHRMFDEPHSQIEYLLRKIQEGRPKGDTQISLWDKNQDQEAEISPCTQIIWGRLKHGALELHVHAHSSDAYQKLFMNIQEFVSLHLYLAERLGVPAGTYYHMIDSCHLHRKHMSEIEGLAKALGR